VLVLNPTSRSHNCSKCENGFRSDLKLRAAVLENGEESRHIVQRDIQGLSTQAGALIIGNAPVTTLLVDVP
jgi:hypothetical protein